MKSPIAIMVFLTVGMNTDLVSSGEIILQSPSASTLGSTTDSILDSTTYSTTYTKFEHTLDSTTESVLESTFDSTSDSTLVYVTESAPPSTTALEAKGWGTMATSKNYINSKLVLESVSPFSLQYIHKSYSEGTVGMVCGKVCASNAKCQAFNLYPTNSHYVCEYLHENFCFPRQRMALQAWPRGIVWDKLQPGMTKACIDQKFATQASTKYCDIGRFGCRSVWPNCDACVKTCSDCKTAYSLTGLYNCTLWPEGAFRPPIFAYCSNTATFLIQRQINFIGLGGKALPDYSMPFPEMNRLSRLNVYKSLIFFFNASDNSNQYFTTYKNFAIDFSGTLMNMTWKSGSGYDGFNTGSNPLKPAPWVTTISSSSCGSFWLLNYTQGSLATMDCPGGGVNMFGNIYTDWSGSIHSGIRWPTVPDLLTYTDVKMDL